MITIGLYIIFPSGMPDKAAFFEVLQKLGKIALIGNRFIEIRLVK